MSYVSFDSSSGGSPPSITLPGTTSTWTTLAPSQLNSSHCLAALVMVGSNNLTFGARQTGQTGYTQTYPTALLANQQVPIFVPLSNGTFDLFMSNLSATIYLIGAWTNNDFIPVTPTALSVTGTATNYNLGTLIGSSGAQGAVITGALYGANFIQPGSSDVFVDSNEGTDYRSWIVGADSSQNINAKCVTAATVYIHGYFSQGLVWHNNSVNVTPASSGSNQNLTPASGDTGALAYLFDQKASAGSQTYTFSEQGSGLSIGKAGSGGRHSQAIAAAPSQVNESTTSLTIWELGYFIATGSAPVIGNGSMVVVGGPGVQPYTNTMFLPQPRTVGAKYVLNPVQSSGIIFGGQASVVGTHVSGGGGGGGGGQPNTANASQRTYLQIVNAVLTNLRELNVTSVNASTYSQLIGEFVNIAKETVEDSWNWSVLETDITFTTVQGTGTPTTGTQVAYFLDNISTNSPLATSSTGRFPDHRSYVLRDDFGKYNSFDVTLASSLVIYQLVMIPRERAAGDIYLAPARTVSTPYVFSYDWIMGRPRYTLINPPYPGRIITTRFIIPQPAFIPGTDENTALLVPWRPVISLATAMAMQERGEELGQSADLYMARYNSELTRAQELDRGYARDYLYSQDMNQNTGWSL